MKFVRKYFDPSSKGTVDSAQATVSVRAEDGSVHLYDEEIILAVNVALTIGRPLLVSGEPGSGKTTLARSVASVLGWRSYHKVITSRIQAQDLEWTFDSLRRLGDATAGKENLLPRPFYLEPGVLWWAFDPTSAVRRGLDEGPAAQGKIPSERFAKDQALVTGNEKAAVVLLDEIDKADPDVPNDLLEPLDVKQFTVEETGFRVSQDDRKVLVVITTNGERDLPPAFLRRCVSLVLPAPTEDWLVAIANRRFPGKDPIYKRIAAELMTMREDARRQGLRPPSTAEYLDALQVCRDLQITSDSPTWVQAAKAVLWKHERERKPAPTAPARPS